MVTAWRMRRELGMEIAHRIYLYLVQKYQLGKIIGYVSLTTHTQIYIYTLLKQIYENAKQLSLEGCPVATRNCG